MYLPASLLVAIIAVIWFFGLDTLARRLERIADREWETSFGDAGRQVLLARYGETDERGRQLVAIASRLGIELEARAEPRATDQAMSECHRAIADYLKAVVLSPEARLDPPPADVAAFVSERDADIDALANLLIAQRPRLEIQIRPDLSPSLFGLLKLNRVLLADSIVHSRAGDAERMRVSLEAAWETARYSLDMPVLISYLLGQAMLRMEAGLLRKIEPIDDAWMERLDPAPMRALRVVALAGESRYPRLEYLHEVIARKKAEDRSGPFAAMRAFVSRPYRRLCDADYCRRMRAGVTIFATWKNCTAPPGELLPPAARPAWWNFDTGDTLDRTLGTWAKLDRLTLDLELTRKVLQAKALRRSDAAARWPGQIPGIESSACADGRWTYAVGADGAMRLAHAGATPESPGTWSAPLEYRDGP